MRSFENIEKDNERVEIQCYCRLLIIVFLNTKKVNDSIVDGLIINMKEYIMMVAYG